MADKAVQVAHDAVLAQTSGMARSEVRKSPQEEAAEATAATHALKDVLLA